MGKLLAISESGQNELLFQLKTGDDSTSSEGREVTFVGTANAFDEAMNA